MAKTRISVRLDPDIAARVKEHAERAGIDVSAYLENAALRQMAETDASEAQFARIDAEIAAAEAEAAKLPPLPEVTDEDLTEEERRWVQEAMDLIHGTDRPTKRDAHPGEAA